MKPAGCFDHVDARSEPKVIGVAEDDPGVEIRRLEFLKPNAFDRARRSDRHEDRRLDLADDARNRRIPTSQLNDFFERAIAQPRGGIAPSPAKGGMSRLKVRYLTQVRVRPPTFVVFTSGGKPGLHFSYERYLVNRLREEFDFFATPLRIVEKHKKFSRKGAK